MLRLRTFGSVALLDGERVLEGPMTQRRRLALLALLAAAGDTGVSRDKLVGLLWPESEEGKARHSLSQWLFLLRKDLPTGALVGTEELRLDPALVASDVAEFGQALARQDPAAAVEVYAAPFLDGFFLPGAAEFERWAAAERETLARRWREAVETLARRAASAGDAAAAASLWRRLASADPTDGRVAVELMRALDAAGDRAAALAHARVHGTLLREEFQLPPDPLVDAAAEAIRSAPPREATAVAAPTDAATTPVQPAHAPAVPATPAAAPAPSPISGTTPARATRRRAGRWAARAALAGVAVAAVLAGGAFMRLPKDRRATALLLLRRDEATLDPRRVVVAPLENATGDTSLTAFGEMAAEAIGRALARTAEFEVVDARTASLTARVVRSLPPLLLPRDRAVALAQETGSGTVLWGRYYREGDSLRVVVNLTDVERGGPRKPLDPVAGAVAARESLAVEVSRRVAGQLAAAVDTSAAGQGVGQAPPPSYDAYRETLGAWGSYYVGDFRGAFAHAARAAELDSTYMLPLVIRAFFHSEWREWAPVDSLVRRVEPRVAALSPLERAGFDMVREELRGDLEAQLRATREVARLTPGSAEARTHVAHVAVTVSRPREALAVLEEVDPDRGVMLVVPFYYNWRTAALHELGEHGEELTDARRGFSRFPNRHTMLLCLARTLGATGRADEVRAVARRVGPDRWDPPAVHRRALVEGSRELRAHGHPREAAALLGEALALFAAERDTTEAGVEARAILLAEAGRDADAGAALAWRLARGGGAPPSIAAAGLSGVLAARRGDAAAAARADSALAKGPWPFRRGRDALWRARIAAAQGDRHRAVALLQQAIAEGYPVLQGHASFPGARTREFDYAETAVHADPFLDALRDDAAYRALLQPRG